MNILAVILNFFVPGVGSFFVGRGGAGVAQLLIFVMGLVLVFTILFSFFGAILMAVAWLWGLYTAATATNDPQRIEIVERDR